MSSLWKGGLEGIDMSMFGDGDIKEYIYQDLKYNFNERYGDWENAEYKLEFTIKVLEVLESMFGDW